MSVQVSDEEWQGLVARVAEVAGVEPSTVTAETRLIEDLGLDSLALTELLVAVISEHYLDDVAAELAERRWEGTTVAELCDDVYRPRLGTT